MSTPRGPDLPRRLALITWDKTRPSGGNVYNAELARALDALGHEIEIVRLPGGWPEPSAADREGLARALTQTLAQRQLAIVDGIVASACPGEIAAAVRAGGDVSVLVHMPIAAEPGLAADSGEAANSGRATNPGLATDSGKAANSGRATNPGLAAASGPATAARIARVASEHEALCAASRVFAPSEWAAADLLERYSIRAHVARPGVRPAPIARGSDPLRIVCLGTLSPGKGQLALVQALAQVADLPWTAALIGSVDDHPDYAAEVAAAVRGNSTASGAASLAERITITGELTGAALEAHWQAADLLVLPSTYETFGLVTLEALAHGVPIVVRAGTGAVEALHTAAEDGSSTRTRGEGTEEASSAVGGFGTTAEGEVEGLAGCAVGQEGLARALRAWLTDPDLRARWRDAARAARADLPGWDETARQVVMRLSDSPSAAG